MRGSLAVVLAGLLAAGLGGCYDPGLGRSEPCDRELLLEPHTQPLEERARITNATLTGLTATTASFAWEAHGDALCTFVSVHGGGPTQSPVEPQYGNGSFAVTVTGLRPGTQLEWAIVAPGLDGVWAGSPGQLVRTPDTTPVGSPLQVAYVDVSVTNVVWVAYHVLGGDADVSARVEWLRDGGVLHATEPTPGQGLVSWSLPAPGQEERVAGQTWDGAPPGNYTVRVVATDGRGQVASPPQVAEVPACQPRDGAPSWTFCPGRDAREPDG